MILVIRLRQPRLNAAYRNQFLPLMPMIGSPVYEFFQVIDALPYCSLLYPKGLHFHPDLTAMATIS